MAQVRGLSASKIQVGSWALLSRIKQPRLALSFAVAGALSFWLPDVVIHIDAGRNFDSNGLAGLVLGIVASLLRIP